MCCASFFPNTQPTLLLVRLLLHSSYSHAICHDVMSCHRICQAMNAAPAESLLQCTVLRHWLQSNQALLTLNPFPHLCAQALLLAFSAAELSFGMAVAAVFSRAKIAAIVGPLAHFALLLPRYVFFRSGETHPISALEKKLALDVGLCAAATAVQPTDVYTRHAGCMSMLCAGEPQALWGKWVASLLAPTAFTFGADLLAQYEVPWSSTV